MLRNRLIPVLTIESGALTKTRGFKSFKYLGEPLNTVRIFNDLEVDELMVLDITEGKVMIEEDFVQLSHLAGVSRMPITYGGGVKSAKEVERLVSLGIEKVLIASQVWKDDMLVPESIRVVGAQSVVMCIDYRLVGWRKRREVVINRGKDKIGKTVEQALEKARLFGVGEVVLSSVDRDGMRTGYDLELARKLNSAVQMPVTFTGGCSCFEDICELKDAMEFAGAAGSTFYSLQGKFDALLPTYPSEIEKGRLLGKIGR